MNRPGVNQALALWGGFEPRAARVQVRMLDHWATGAWSRPCTNTSDVDSEKNWFESRCCWSFLKGFQLIPEAILCPESFLKVKSDMGVNFWDETDYFLKHVPKKKTSSKKPHSLAHSDNKS